MGKPEEAHVQSRGIGWHENKFRAHAQGRLDRDRVEPAYRIIEYDRAKEAELGIAFAQDLRAIRRSRRMVLEECSFYTVAEKILSILVSTLLALLTIGRSVNVQIKSSFEQFSDWHTRSPCKELRLLSLLCARTQPRE